MSAPHPLQLTVRTWPRCWRLSPVHALLQHRGAACGRTVYLPKLEAFAPDILLISAGFDAHQADPLAALALNEADYAWVTRALCQVAARHSQNRVVSALEGGYDLDALASSAKAHVQALMGA